MKHLDLHSMSILAAKEGKWATLHFLPRKPWMLREVAMTVVVLIADSIVAFALTLDIGC